MNKEEDFVQIIQSNDGVIYKIVRAYTDDKESQKDLYQEVVYQLWKSFPSFRGDAKVSTWMYRIALNTAITHLQKGKRRPVTVELKLDHLQLKSSDQANELEEQMQYLYKHIKGLNLIDKGIILLYLEGNSYEEIGEIMGFSVSRIGTRLSRIKEKLKKKINT